MLYLGLTLEDDSESAVSAKYGDPSVVRLASGNTFYLLYEYFIGYQLIPMSNSRCFIFKSLLHIPGGLSLPGWAYEAQQNNAFFPARLSIHGHS